MSTTVTLPTVLVNVILLEPIDNERVLLLFELIIPVVKLPFKLSVPEVNVVVPVTINADDIPTVIPAPLTVKPVIVLSALVRVPVPRIVTVKPLYVPVLDNVKLAPIFNDSADVPFSTPPVVPKLRFLNQLPLEIICDAEPLPVIVKSGALNVAPPATDPNANNRCTDASVVKPPVPV